MANNVWSAAGDDSASNIACWSAGHVPTTGDNIIFNVTSIKNCNWDVNVTDLADYTVAAAYTGTITQNQAFGMTGTCTITGGTASGFNGNSKTITCRGWSSSANLTTNVSVVVFDGSGNIAHSGSTRYLLNTTINAGVTMTVTSGSAFGTGNGQTLSIAATGKLTINAAQTWLMNNCYAQIANSGTIDGAGSINFIISSTGTLGTTGTISCTTAISTIAANNYVVTLGANTTFSGALNVNNSVTTGTCTLSSNTGDKTLTVTGTCTLGNYGIFTQGATAWAFGVLTINGNASTDYTSKGVISVTGAVTITSDTLVCGALAASRIWTFADNLTVSGTLQAYGNAGSTITTYFNKAGTATLAAAGTATFEIMSIDAATTLNLSDNISVVANGFITFGSGGILVPASGKAITFA